MEVMQQKFPEIEYENTGKGATKCTVTVWRDKLGWCVSAEAGVVYVFQSMKSALHCARVTLEEAYK